VFLMSFLITATTQVMCPHGGQAVVGGFVAATVLVEGAPVVNQLMVPVAGCPGTGGAGSATAKTGSHHVYQFMSPCNGVLFQPAHPTVLAEGQPIAGFMNAVTMPTGAPAIIANHPVTVMAG
jgi:hypothetical protein